MSSGPSGTIWAGASGASGTTYSGPSGISGTMLLGPGGWFKFIPVTNGGSYGPSGPSGTVRQEGVYGWK